MGTPRKVIHQAKVASVSNHLPGLRVPLAQIYYQAWSQDGLCSSLAEAQAKIDRFDPDQAFVLLDKGSRPLALVNSLLTDAPDIPSLIEHYPTYASVEAASAQKKPVYNPTYRICFSLTALPGYRIQTSHMSTDVSLSRFLLEHLPQYPQKLAYSRLPAVGLHQHLGARVVATLENSRPEDLVGLAKNVLLLYP